MAAYSCWPAQGWDSTWRDLADACKAHGGEIRLAVDRVVIEDGKVKGVALSPGRKAAPDRRRRGGDHRGRLRHLDAAGVERAERGSGAELPDWYSAQIRHLAQDRFRVAWLGLYIATDEPVHMYDPRELSTWVRDPGRGIARILLHAVEHGSDDGPAGQTPARHGRGDPGRQGARSRLRPRDVREVRGGHGGDVPAVEEAPLATPSPGVRPGLRRHLQAVSGRSLPSDWKAPNVSGLYFTSQTFKSRGIGVDRSARAALTCIEHSVGRRLRGSRLLALLKPSGRFR